MNRIEMHLGLYADMKDLESIRKALSFDQRENDIKAEPNSTHDEDSSGETREGRQNGEAKIPKTKKMNLEDFIFIKVLGKGSFGKVNHK